MSNPEVGGERPEARRPLTLREYIGVFAPRQPRRQSESTEPLPPLTLREYISVSPLPNIDEIVDATRVVGRGVRRLWNKVFGRGTLPQHSQEQEQQQAYQPEPPKDYSPEDLRDFIEGKKPIPEELKNISHPRGVIYEEVY